MELHTITAIVGPQTEVETATRRSGWFHFELLQKTTYLRYNRHPSALLVLRHQSRSGLTIDYGVRVSGYFSKRFKIFKLELSEPHIS